MAALWSLIAFHITFRVAEPEGLARRLPLLANGVTDQGLGEESAANEAGNPVLGAVPPSADLSIALPYHFRSTAATALANQKSPSFPLFSTLAPGGPSGACPPEKPTPFLPSGGGHFPLEERGGEGKAWNAPLHPTVAGLGLYGLGERGAGKHSQGGKGRELGADPLPAPRTSTPPTAPGLKGGKRP